MKTETSKLIDIECEIRCNESNSRAIAIATGVEELTNDPIGIKRLREKWFWLPKSQVEINDDGTVTVPEWLAIKKGLV